MKDVNSLTMHDHGLYITASILYEFLEAGLALLNSGARMAASLRFMNVHDCRSAVGSSTLQAVGATSCCVGGRS